MATPELVGWGSPVLAWLLHMARRAVSHRHTVGVTFLPILDLQACGNRVPRSGFLLVGRGRRKGGNPESGEGPRFGLPQVSSPAPLLAQQLPTVADLGNNACGVELGAGAAVSSAGWLAWVLSLRTPSDAGLPSFDRRGSLTRTVLSTMVNKEKLFAAFNEWDSASYRPHSESSIRYNPDSVVLGKWPPPWVAFRVSWAGHLCRLAAAALALRELVQMEPG